MALTNYTFSLSADFPNHLVNIDRLTREISTSSIVTALDHIDVGITDPNACDIWFKDALSSGDQTTLTALVTAHTGDPLPDGTRDAAGNKVVSLATRQADGTSLVAVKARFGKEVIYASHSFCDKTTWYWDSDRVTDKVLTQNGTTWESGDVNWIDLEHGKIFDEEAVKVDQATFHPPPHGYAIIVKVDGVTQTPCPAWKNTGGDYTIDYANGTVTPVGADWTGHTVTASYSKAATSGWVMIPTTGRALIIEAAEIQFSDDIVFNANLVIEIYGAIDYFAPELLQSNGGPYPPGTQVPIETTVYKTIDQYIDEAIGAYPAIPAFSNAAGRGYTRPRYIFQFHYTSARPLFSSLGMYMRIHIDGDEPFGGERSTATFYCLSKDDLGAAAGLAILNDASGG